LGNDLTVNGVGVGYTTGKWEYNAGYTVLTDDVNGTYKTTQTAATARYNLSKRTSVYGGYGHGKNEGANNKVGVIFGGAALATANTTNDGLIFGLRHQF
jgi:predicted porin